MSQRVLIYLDQLNNNSMSIANYLKHKQTVEKKRLIMKDLKNIGMNTSDSRNATDALFKGTPKRKMIKRKPKTKK